MDPYYERVAAEYQGVRDDLEQVGGDLKKYREQTEKNVSDVSARMQALEQHVVTLSPSGSMTFAGNGPAMAQEAISELEESNSFAALKEWNMGTCRAKLNSSIRAALTNDGKGTSSDSSIPSQPERRGFVSQTQRPLRLLDVLPSRPTKADAVEFVQLNTTGDAAEQVTEGEEKAEIDIEGELVRAEIATIAAHSTASRQVLSDHSALQTNIDGMIQNKLLSRLEHQIINGDGSAGKIDGLLSQAAVFLPTIGTTPADIIGEALMRQANAGYQPNLVIMNPADWFRIQVTRKSATEEEYVFGSPTVPVPPALWNAAIVTTPSISEGEAITVDTRFTTVLDRETPTILLSNSHKDYFTRNLVAILGELRAGLEVLDTFAIYKMDLYTSGG